MVVVCFSLGVIVRFIFVLRVEQGHVQELLASATNNTEQQKALGQQGLFTKVERFDAVSNKVSKPWPDVQNMHLDFDQKRLTATLNKDNEGN